MGTWANCALCAPPEHRRTLTLLVSGRLECALVRIRYVNGIIPYNVRSVALATFSLATNPNCYQNRCEIKYICSSRKQNPNTRFKYCRLYAIDVCVCTAEGNGVRVDAVSLCSAPPACCIRNYEVIRHAYTCPCPAEWYACVCVCMCASIFNVHCTRVGITQNIHMCTLTNI